MLVLFDLDDTLIETSKYLTPRYLRGAYDAMVAAGLKTSAPLEQLLSINVNAKSSHVAIEDFWKLHSKDEEVLFAGKKSLKMALPEDAVIPPVEGAIEILDLLKRENHQLALVTRGDRDLQLQKMKKAGIQPDRFSKLVVSTGLSKKFDYQQVLDQLQASPKEAIVCGDRVFADLTPAKALGMYTVHFRNGRGIVHDSPKESVDVTIETLLELQEVFAKYEK